MDSNWICEVRDLREVVVPDFSPKELRCYLILKLPDLATDAGRVLQCSMTDVYWLVCVLMCWAY